MEEEDWYQINMYKDSGSWPIDCWSSAAILLIVLVHLDGVAFVEAIILSTRRIHFLYNTCWFSRLLMNFGWSLLFYFHGLTWILILYKEVYIGFCFENDCYSEPCIIFVILEFYLRLFFYLQPCKQCHNEALVLITTLQ